MDGDEDETETNQGHEVIAFCSTVTWGCEGRVIVNKGARDGFGQRVASLADFNLINTAKNQSG